MELAQPPNKRMEEPGSNRLGRYEIQEELGRGAMGAVYKAFDPVIARTVALKTILIDDHTPDRAQMIERLKQEAKAAGGLDHPNIITIYDVGEENGAVYLSMQFVKGVTLAKVLADAGVPALPKLLAWADQILAAVGFAHARNVIHRDLKPANIMATDEGIIKVLDFGIAKIENTALTQTGLVIGTPGYMSPEQIVGKKVDHRADIFSLGAVFYELLTREKPFAGDIATILYKIVNEDPVAPSLINPAIPGGIDAVIRKALAKDPKDRFQSCEEMRHAFLGKPVSAPVNAAASAPAKRVLDNRPSAPAGVRRAPQPEEASSRIWPSLILISVLVLVAAAGWAFYVRSYTGAFPPLIAKLEKRIEPALTSTAGHLTENPTSAQHRTADERSIEPAPAQNPQTATAPANALQAPATQAPATPTTAAEAPVSPEKPNPAVPTLQPVAQQSSADHPTVEGGASSGTPATSPVSETSSKPVDPFQHAPTQAGQSADNNQTAASSSTANDSPTTRALSENGKQTATPAARRPFARVQTPDASSKVDGFTRQDVPDLLRQADSSSARGDYRLARYEYGLVLKLDRNNIQAREGLRRLLAAWQAR